jgi:hypothetical protein
MMVFNGFYNMTYFLLSTFFRIFKLKYDPESTAPSHVTPSANFNEGPISKDVDKTKKKKSWKDEDGLYKKRYQEFLRIYEDVQQLKRLALMLKEKKFKDMNIEDPESLKKYFTTQKGCKLQ